MYVLPLTRPTELHSPTDDGTLISGLQAFQSWNDDLGLTDNPNSAALLGLLNAAGPLSGFVIGPIIQWIDDTFGRRWGIRFYGYTILTGTVISVVAGVNSAKGNSGYTLFVIGRFIIGFGQASFLMTSLVVVQEITHPRTRETVAGSWDSYYIIGMVLASWVNFGTSFMSGSWGWRLPYLLQVPMALYVLIAVQFMPETPRYLISKGEDEKALQFMATYHGNGDASDPLVVFEFQEMKDAIEAERIAKAEKWSTILRSPSNRHRLGLAALMSFLTNLSGSSIIFYYYSVVFDLVGITDTTTQTGIAAGMNVFQWIAQIAAIWTGKYVGRKKIILANWPMLLLVLVGLTVSGATFAHSGETDHKSAVATVALVWIYMGFYNFCNPILYSYPAEVQTFSMRSKGLLIWNSVTQIQAIYVTFVDSIALDAIGYKYYIVYMPLVILQIFLVKYFMVETKGFTLEEVALAFENASSTNLPMIRDAEAAGTVDTASVGGDSKE